MMKYRVIKRTDVYGNTVFYPQYKKMLLWQYFDDVVYDAVRDQWFEMSRAHFASAVDAFAFIDKKPLQNLVVKREEYEVQKENSSD